MRNIYKKKTNSELSLYIRYLKLNCPLSGSLGFGTEFLITKLIHSSLLYDQVTYNQVIDFLFH